MKDLVAFAEMHSKNSIKFSIDPKYGIFVILSMRFIGIFYFC